MSTRRTRAPRRTARMRRERKIINRAFDKAQRYRPAKARRPKRRINKNGKLKTNIKSGLRLLSPIARNAISSGFSDFKVGGNSLMIGGMTVPQITNSAQNGAVILRHREYLGDVNATTPFTITSYNINSGLLQTFPWLSQVAANFEQYRFRGLLFEFKSLSSDAVLSSATSSALGAIVMATQYDVLDPVFTDKFNMENYEFANSCKPSSSMIHPVECAKSQTTISELYVRDGAVPANADQRLYDLGRFSIATVGMQASSGVAGELWVTYEVELFKPKLINALGLEIPTDHFEVTGTYGPTQPFGTTTVPILGSSIGGIIDTTGATYVFPPNVVDGHYLFLYVAQQSAGADTGAFSISVVNCVGLTWFLNTYQSISVTSTVATVNILTAALISVTGSVASLTLSYAGSGTYVGADLTVTQINGATASALRKRVSLAKEINRVFLTSAEEPRVDAEIEAEDPDYQLFMDLKKKLSLSN